MVLYFFSGFSFSSLFWNDLIRVKNSNSSNILFNDDSFTLADFRLSMLTSREISVLIVASIFENLALSLPSFSIFATRAFSILSKFSITPSTVPNSRKRGLAFAGPIPLTPGILSELSPTSPR